MSDPTDRPSSGGHPPGRRGIPSKRLVPRAAERTFRRLFSARFRAAREALPINQPDLALRLGVSQGRIAHYETGRGLPRAYEVPTLCRVLRCDPNFLLSFQGWLRQPNNQQHPSISETSIMSRHSYSAIYSNRKVEVTIGFDRPLQEFFMTIQYLEPSGTEAEEEDEESDIVYSNLSDPDAPCIRDLAYFRAKLRSLDITVPESMLREVQNDADHQVGNRIVRHFEDGTMAGPGASSKITDVQIDPLRVGSATHLPGGIVQFQEYVSGETGIEVIDDRGNRYVATASIVPYGGPHPGETGVWLKGWSENEGVPQALEAAGILRLTGRTCTSGFATLQHAELTEPALRVRGQQLNPVKR